MDAIQEIISQAFSNIKTLKLNAWTEVIEKRIKEKRDDELKILKLDNLVSQFIVTTLYFFPQVLGAVVFSVYIGTGHHIDLG